MCGLSLARSMVFLFSSIDKFILQMGRKFMVSILHNQGKKASPFSIIHRNAWVFLEPNTMITHLLNLYLDANATSTPKIRL